MGIPVKRYQRKPTFGGKNVPMKYHLRQEPGSYKVMTTEKIVKLMERTGVFRAQKAIRTIERFVSEIKSELIEGNLVKMAGLERFISHSQPKELLKRRLAR